jgi:hypothetical protein
MKESNGNYILMNEHCDLCKSQQEVKHTELGNIILSLEELSRRNMQLGRIAEQIVHAK